MEVHRSRLILMLTCILVTLNGVDMQNSKCPVGEVMIHGDDCIQCTHQFCRDNPKLCSDCQGPCDSNPCINGRCSDGPNRTYTCSCMDGWTGLDCTMRVILYCESNPCHHHGTCTEGPDSYICSCLPEWMGANCETQVTGPCDSNPCLNGRCSEGPNGTYTCSCMDGSTGLNCTMQDANARSSSQTIHVTGRSYFTVLMGAILAILMVLAIYM